MRRGEDEYIHIHRGDENDGKTCVFFSGVGSAMSVPGMEADESRAHLHPPMVMAFLSFALSIHEFCASSCGFPASQSGPCLPKSDYSARAFVRADPFDGPNESIFSSDLPIPFNYGEA